MTISSAALLPILDSIGKQYEALLTIPTSDEAVLIQTGADNNVTRALAFTDLLVAADFSAAIATMEVNSHNPQKAASDMFSVFFQRLTQHLGNVNINTYLADNSAKVSKSLATLWRSLGNPSVVLPAVVFEDTLITLATYAVTGSGTGTPNYSGGPLDMTLVAPSQLELEVTTDIGAAGTVTITCVQANGTGTVVETVDLDTDSDVGDKFDIGDPADVYRDVSLITISGLTSGAFRIQNKRPRVPAL